MKKWISNIFNIKNITQLTQIATLISIIAGIYVTASSAISTLDSSRISAFNEIKPILKEDLLIRKKINDYMQNQIEKDIAHINDAISQGKSGESLFYSEALNEYQQITVYYNNLGSSLHWENMEFNILFDMIAFPDSFYLKTKTIRKSISDNWHAKDAPLQDFFSDFEALCIHYQKKRAERGYKHLKLSDCKY